MRLVAKHEAENERVAASAHLNRVPEDVLYKVLQLLEPFDILSMRQVSTRLAAITRTRIVWLFSVRKMMSEFGLAEGHHTYPLSTMNSNVLEGLAFRPARLLRRWNSGSSMPRNSIELTIPVPAHSSRHRNRPTSSITIMTIIPGGRWLLAVAEVPRRSTPVATPRHTTVLLLWDLGDIATPPSPMPVSEIEYKNESVTSLNVEFIDKAVDQVVLVIEVRALQPLGAPGSRIEAHLLTLPGSSSLIPQLRPLSVMKLPGYNVRAITIHGRLVSCDLDIALLFWDIVADTCALVEVPDWTPSRNPMPPAIKLTDNVLLLAKVFYNSLELRAWILPRKLHPRPSTVQQAHRYCYSPIARVPLPLGVDAVHFPHQSAERRAHVRHKLECTTQCLCRCTLFMFIQRIRQCVTCSIPCNGDLGFVDSLGWSEVTDYRNLIWSSGPCDNASFGCKVLWQGSIGSEAEQLDVTITESWRAAVAYMTKFPDAESGLATGETRMEDVEDGSVRKVFESEEDKLVTHVAIDEMSGRMCVVESDKDRTHSRLTVWD